MGDHALGGETAERIETICAPATPPGSGGVAVVRLSGPNAPAIASTISGPLPPPRYAALRTFTDVEGGAIDHGLVLYFPAPHSYTGEDVVEFHGHGGPAVVERLLRSIVVLGARPAEPGEFTQRAYLNGRIDLSQAEAVAALIDAESEAAAAAALRSLEGAFGRAVDELAGQIADLRAEIEAGLDFPDEEDVPMLAGDERCARIGALRTAVDEVRRKAQAGVQVGRTGDLAIVGAPNMGKSSLLNALAGKETAIVHAEAGTTRDLVAEAVRIAGRSVRLVDTAGLRDGPEVGPVEREGVRRALSAAEGALHVLLVLEDGLPADAAVEGVQQRIVGEQITLVRTKIDRTGGPGGLRESTLPGVMEIGVSARQGDGLDVLTARMEEVVGATSGEDAWAARERHIEALDRASGALQRASSVERGEEVVAEELRYAQDALGEITGRVTTEELLERIFSSFCIGK